MSLFALNVLLALGWALAREDLFVAVSVHLVVAARWACPGRPARASGMLRPAGFAVTVRK